jgi:hypothetical protein
MAGTTISHKIGLSASAPSSLSSLGKPVYLELCVNTDLRTQITRLVEIMIVDGMGRQLITTDVELFASISKAYKSTKRKGLLRIFAFMLRPKDIHYVHFAMHYHRAIIFGNPPTPSLPPAVEVDEKRYHYSGHLVGEDPMHRDFFLMYSRQHKDCDPRGAVFLNRLPKKLGTSMTVLSRKNPHELEFGWGIHIIEGPNKAAIATMVSINLIMGFIVTVSYNAPTWALLILSSGMCIGSQ